MKQYYTCSLGFEREEPFDKRLHDKSRERISPYDGQAIALGCIHWVATKVIDISEKKVLQEYFVG